MFLKVNIPVNKIYFIQSRRKAMASKGNFMSKFLSFMLLIFIVGGVGFLGYSLLKSNGDMSMDSMNGSMTTRNNDMISQPQDTMNTGADNDDDTQYSTVVISSVLQNKENLEKTIKDLNSSINLMTLDPYSAENNQHGSQDQTSAGETASQGSQVTGMQSMGTTYDAAKMEKLHTGLYKVSVGMKLLKQLNDNMEVQYEKASMEINNPTEYYYNQYLITVQNKTKLSEALTHVNEASSLLNINPYVSQSGSVYDKEKMSNIHDSIYELAQTVIDLNKINDDLANQAITLGNVTQGYIDNANSMQDMNMESTNIFSNINVVSLLNIAAIAFMAIFVVSIIGYIYRLLRTPAAPK
jgi:hypothetical protein